jgi:hypothetical protein
MNKTEYTFSRTVEVMHQVHKKITEAPGNSHEAAELNEVLGEHAILVFLLYRIFLTAGWGA